MNPNDFVDLFHRHFQHLYRFLDRQSGEPELAADLAQEAFLRLYRRTSPPDRPEAWLITVAINLLRNARVKRARRSHLLTPTRGEYSLGDPPPSPADALDCAEVKLRVRSALDRMPDRERSLLLLRAEGYAYREIAAALSLREASIGTLLARAKRVFRELYEDTSHAP